MTEPDANTALLDWVEKAALENLKAHVQSADELKREANIALNVFLGGMAASFGFAVHSFDNGDVASAAAAAAFSLSMFALGCLVLRYCLRVGRYPAPSNEPRQLLLFDVDFEKLRVDELNNMQIRIEEAKARNELKANWLNLIRAAALFTPLIPVAVLLIRR